VSISNKNRLKKSALDSCVIAQAGVGAPRTFHHGEGRNEIEQCAHHNQTGTGLSARLFLISSPDLFSCTPTPWNYINP
jgi:hypothetical protein